MNLTSSIWAIHSCYCVNLKSTISNILHYGTCVDQSKKKVVWTVVVHYVHTVTKTPSFCFCTNIIHYIKPLCIYLQTIEVCKEIPSVFIRTRGLKTYTWTVHASTSTVTKNCSIHMQRTLPLERQTPFPTHGQQCVVSHRKGNHRHVPHKKYSTAIILANKVWRGIHVWDENLTKGINKI